MTRLYSHSELDSADLLVDAVYESSGDGGLAGEPISKILPGSGNMGGFRDAGRGSRKNFVVLFSTGEDKDWPDSLDLTNGKFVYYGDNKTPGHELHDTGPGGNKILRSVFASLHSEKNKRCEIPPFFVFKKNPTRNGPRSVQFKGLAVPGFPGLAATEDLVAVWKSTESQRFQNYRAIFTMLDVATVARPWIAELSSGNNLGPNAPAAWRSWQTTGRYAPLRANPTISIRSIDQQTPDTSIKREILLQVWKFFKGAPLSFEVFAARIFQMTDSRVIVDEITRGSVDGGRDAIGRYALGLADDPIYADFALEAKCYRPAQAGLDAHSVGVKEVARLISRIRHRQFGVLVTTSVVARQAYQEVRDDRHPIVFITGTDIASILIKNGFNTPESVLVFLQNQFSQ